MDAEAVIVAADFIKSRLVRCVSLRVFFFMSYSSLKSPVRPQHTAAEHQHALHNLTTINLRRINWHGGYLLVY